MKLISYCLQPLVLSLCVGACSSSEEVPPTVDGVSSTRAATIVTDVYCEKLEQCGTISASCTLCSDDEPDCEVLCETTLQPYSAMRCVDDVQMDLERGFGCQDLTPQEVELVDECLAATPSEPCPTVQDVQAWVDAERNGRDPREPIPACDVLLNEIIYRCAAHE